jgi:hypothetical protein
MGFLLKGNYNKLKIDKTNWYAIDYDALGKWIDENANKASNSALGDLP